MGADRDRYGMSTGATHHATALAVGTGTIAGIIWGEGSVLVQGATSQDGAIYGLLIGVIWATIWYLVPKGMAKIRGKDHSSRDRS